VAYKLPDHLTLEDGAMASLFEHHATSSKIALQIEPLSVAIHAVAAQAKLRTNQTIAVWGAGPIGLLCMAAAKALGASRVIGVDIVPSRLEFAKSYAATQTFLPPAPLPNETKPEYSKRSAAAMRDQLGIDDRGANAIDIVVDASGAEVSIQTAMHIVKTGGTYIQVGVHDLDFACI
jgi:D-xylulose reductase